MPLITPGRSITLPAAAQRVQPLWRHRAAGLLCGACRDAAPSM